MILQWFKLLCNVLSKGAQEGGALSNAAYGPGVGHIWLDDVNCQGTEYFIYQCIHPGFGINNCIHTEDASVICLRKLINKQTYNNK